jgi:hypothetical protein
VHQCIFKQQKSCSCRVAACFLLFENTLVHPVLSVLSCFLEKQKACCGTARACFLEKRAEGTKALLSTCVHILMTIVDTSFNVINLMSSPFYPEKIC